MSKEQIISKGEYTLAQPEKMVGVKQYLFVRDEDGKKRLLLRFANNRPEKCSKFAFILYRLDSKGNVLGQDKYESADREFSANGVFSFDRRIAVEEKCSSFRVQMVYARYGNYTYNVERETVSVSYSEKNVTTLDNAKAVTKVKPRKISTRTFDMPWLFVALSVLLLALVVFACGFLLKNFMKEERDFTLSGVSYRFRDRDKKDDVIIMGCADTYSEITITNEIEGHRVVEIDENAFRGKSNLEIVRVEGLNIPDRAFENCKNLESVTIKNVTSIGDRAFSGCSSLETVDISEGTAGQIISLGERAFANCKSLNTVKINQYISYGEKVDYFYGSSSIETLVLWNFAYTSEYLDSEYITKLAALYGEEGVAKPTARLVNLTIGKMDSIPSEFVQGFKYLESVTVSGVEISSVGQYAFADCESLSQLSLKGELFSIGDFAFSNTDIKYLDMSKVSVLGQGVFKNCDMLTSVVGFGQGGIDNIPNNTFEGCQSLEAFEFDKNIKHVYAEAFKGSGLVSISIPVGVSYDSGILKECNRLVELEVYEFGAAGFVGQLFGATRGDNISSDEMAGFIPNTLKTITLGSGTEINESAFKGCKNVTTINLPVDIVSIGANAFSGCKKLAVIDIPVDSMTLKTIGDGAFYKCEMLKYVPLVESVERIGKGAFEGCNSLESIALPFLGATSAVDDDETASYAFGGTIPSSIVEISLHDAKAIDIPTGAFKDCSGVKKIVIPSNVAIIGAKAFQNCTALTTVSLSDGTSKDACADMTKVTDVGAMAFESCASLTSVEFSDKLKTISDKAFAQTGLLRFSVPSSVEYIGDNILDKCNQIGAIVLPYLGARKSTNGSLGYFFNNTIPSSLRSVTVSYFHNNTIGAEAFSGCKNVMSFEIPSDVVAIGESAFEYCSSMSTFGFGDILRVGDRAFYGCTSLKNVDLSHLEDIGDNAFYSCTSITKATLTGATVIGSGAFEKCTSLATVSLGENTLSIGGSAFYETAIKSITVPEGVTDIKDYTFGKCASLVSVSLPSTLTHIGDGAFRETAITSISIPDSVTYIGGFAFRGTSLKSLEIPANATRVGANIIEGCSQLESVTLPLTSDMSEKNLSTYLCNGSFPDTLKKFTINGTTVSYLHSYAFSQDSSLEEIIVDAEIPNIYWGAFYDCTELRYVSLPSNLEYVNSGAFDGCYRLYEISNPSSIYIDCPYVIAYTESQQQRAQIVDRNGCKFANYNGDWYLINYSRGETIEINGVAGLVDEYRIPHHLFSADNQIKTVSLNGNVKEVYNSAFAYCYSLTNVTLANTVERIGNSAFYDCYSLKSISMPTKLKTIGDQAFCNCSALNNVKLYSDVYSIGAEAFYNCRELYDVYCSSNSLSLVAGSKSYGYVARRAVKVHTSMNEASSVVAEVAGVGTFRKCGDAWLLITGANESAVNLVSFVYGGQTVSSYRIAEYAFHNCDSVEYLTIGNAVKQIQYGAFEDCDGLKTVDCSANTSLIEIEGNAFYSCSKLIAINLPSTVTQLGEYVFSYCGRLERVQMPTALQTIGEGAFYDCERLLSITLHQNVSQIGSDAFAGCTYLLEVYDLSPYITVSNSGNNKYENGGVAQNAAAVYTSTAYALERKEQNGIKFIKGNNAWYIYDFNDNGNNILEIPNYDYSLIIMPYSIMYGTFAGIVMPANLTFVDSDAILNCQSFGAVYYMGNSTDWRNVSGSNVLSSYQTIYYKEDCVHYNSSRVWTYDKNGNVTTQRCGETSAITEAATCYENGKRTYYCACSGCSYTRTESISQLTHTFDGNVCTNCGETRVNVNGTNIQDYIDSLTISVEDFEYDTATGRFVSTNKDYDSKSYFIISASHRMTVVFGIEVSGNYSKDYVCVYKGKGTGNAAKYEMITGSESASVNIQLEQGEYIIISYEKGSSSGKNNDCGYIKNLQIIEMKEQQSN